VHAIKDRFNYLFSSTKGLALVAIAMLSLVAAFFGMLSGPMAEIGFSKVFAEAVGMSLLPAEREGRIIMLYHSIAMAVIAVEVYFIADLVKMTKAQQRSINATMTLGYLTSMIFGLWFAYFGHNVVFHGLFIFGQSLVFFAGILLAVALWPWRPEYRVSDPEHSHTKKGADLERAAFFTMAVATLGSALFGAVPGAYYGNGFETFLAENVIRMPEKDYLMLAVIGHLHIMLTLIAVAAMLIVSRWVNFRGILHKIAMPSTIVGTVIITIGVWLVVPYEFIAHYIIYGGSTLILLAGLLLLIFNWNQLIKERLMELGIRKARFWQKLKALVHDPLKFGASWQMLYMNFTTSFIGIFYAIRLDEIIRKWPAREERIELTGHWHILAVLTATILLFYFADLMRMKGKVRKWFGWSILIFTDIAFAATVLFFIKRLFISEASQQPFVDAMMLFTDIGLGTTLVVIAIFMAGQLIDLLKRDGLWSKKIARRTEG